MTVLGLDDTFGAGFDRAMAAHAADPRHGRGGRLTPQQIATARGSLDASFPPRGVHAPAPPPADAASAIPFTLLRPDECAAAPPPDYIVKGLIAAGDMVLLTGQPGAGKSVLAPHLAYAVAQHREAFGRRVRGGPVVYIAAEDAGGMKRRVHALRARHGEAPDFRLLPEAPDLFDASDADLHRLIATVRDLRPRLVVLDTLARAFPGIKENEAPDMGRVIKVAREIIAVTGGAVLIAHHPAKSSEGGGVSRGHGSLHGGADVALTVEIADGGMRTAKLHKNRNGTSEAPGIAFAIEAAEIGVDDDGDRITAAVLREGDSDEIRKRPKIAPQAQKALDFLHDLICERDTLVPHGPNVPPNMRGVPMAAWREACASRGLSGSDEKDHQRRAFNAAFKLLHEKHGLVAVANGWVWTIVQISAEMNEIAPGASRSSRPGKSDGGGRE